MEKLQWIKLIFKFSHYAGGDENKGRRVRLYYAGRENISFRENLIY